MSMYRCLIHRYLWLFNYKLLSKTLLSSILVRLSHARICLWNCSIVIHNKQTIFDVCVCIELFVFAFSSWLNVARNHSDSFHTSFFVLSFFSHYKYFCVFILSNCFWISSLSLSLFGNILFKKNRTKRAMKMKQPNE